MDASGKCPLLEYNKAEGWVAAILEPLPGTMEKVDRGHVSLYLSADKRLLAVKVRDVAGLIREEEERAATEDPLPEQWPSEDFVSYIKRVLGDVPEAAPDEYPLTFWSKDGDFLDVYCVPGSYFATWGPNGVDVFHDHDTREPIGVQLNGIKALLEG
jgi:hypothetical protein